MNKHLMDYELAQIRKIIGNDPRKSLEVWACSPIEYAQKLIKCIISSLHYFCAGGGKNSNKMIALEDLQGRTEAEVLEHLATSYSGKDSGFSYGEISDEDVKEAKEKLANMQVLVAYESVGNWGCDSSSFFLLRDKTSGKMYEVHGSHCSCFGFEGQLDLEETELTALKYRIEKADSLFYCGGYDNNEDTNQKAVNDFVMALEEK